MAGEAEAIEVVIEDENDSVRVDHETGNIETDTPDGGVVVQFGAARKATAEGTENFDSNLAEDMDEEELSRLAEELLDGIRADDASRQEYLQIRARGLALLGTKLEAPKASVGDSVSGMNGISSVTNPLLLDACLRGWANAYGELLPASGPVKIRNDGDDRQISDEMAERLERDMNHYLTVTAKEYYPDTSQMLLWGVYFGGSGFKKVSRCPMRRRPVSESVDAKDLIVSDTTKDLKACGRITHEITMRPSVMKRMMHLGAYRETQLTQPTPTQNVVDTQIAGIQGTMSQRSRPEDQPYSLYETQCEFDLPEFAPKEYSDEGIPLPYLVTIDKDSRKILSIRRDWKEDDDQCERRQMYVKYPYVPGPGFYGTGLLNILGNASAAMTAAWREALDTAMYANFPGGLIAKSNTRQNNSQFTLAPGEFAPIDTNGGPIQEAVMPLPYKDVTGGILSLMDKITSQAKALGGAADIPSAEGIANVPVGTMLAQIEQATKVMAAAHRGMHTAQSEEFELLLGLFRDSPEDFWRGNKECPKNFWSEEKFLQALDNCKLVPCADPNVPSHIHRVGKAVALSQLITVPPFTALMNAEETLRRILSAMREDPNGLLMPPPPAPGPSLMEQAQMKAADARVEANAVKAQTEQVKATAKVGETMAKERMSAATNATKKDVESMRLAQALVKTDAEQSDSSHRKALEIGDRAMEARRFEHDSSMDQAKAATDLIKIANTDTSPGE